MRDVRKKRGSAWLGFIVAFAFSTVTVSAYAWHKTYFIDYDTIPNGGSCCFGIGEGLGGSPTFRWGLDQGQGATWDQDETTVHWNLLNCGFSYGQPMYMRYTVEAGLGSQFGHSNEIDCGIC